MDEGKLIVVRDDSPAMLQVRQQGNLLSADLKDMAEAKPSLLVMREGARVLDDVGKFTALIHGVCDAGISQAYKIWKERVAVRSVLLRLPLDSAFGSKYRGLIEAGAIEKQLTLIPKRAIADSKFLIEQKKAEERRQLEDAQRKAQEAERAAEVQHLEEQGQVEAAEDLQAAPLPPVVMPVETPVMKDVSTTQRYLVEGIEVTSLAELVGWLATQPPDLIEKLVEVKKGAVAAYLNATAGATIPGIQATKSNVVVDRRK